MTHAGCILTTSQWLKKWKALREVTSVGQTALRIRFSSLPNINKQQLGASAHQSNFPCKVRY